MMTLRTGNNRTRDAEAPRRAFTLIELVLVMALLSIVLAVAFPSLRNFFRGRNLDSEARRFLALTRYGQSRAVSEGVPMILWMNTKQGTYGLQAQAGFLDPDDKAVEFNLDETLEFEVSMPLASGTATQRGLVNAIGGNLPGIRFTPDGFIGESSPERVLIRQGESEQLSIIQNPDRLKYEIGSSHQQTARR
jgi:type II secretion system protein H